MEKRGILVVLSLFVIKFVSAQFGFGGYGGSFSISNFFDTVDPSTIVYGLLFFILFTFIYLALTRMNLFKTKGRTPWEGSQTNTIAAGVISFSISALMVYYIYRSGYDVSSLLADLGFQGNILSLIMMLLFVVIAIFIIIKLKFAGFLMISGFLIIVVAMFTDLIYEKGTAFIIGLALLVIGIFIATKLGKKKIKSF